jgi:membrane-associated phospholipid phosphatase
MQLRSSWNGRFMPLVVLVLIALLIGCAAAIAAWRYPYSASRGAAPTFEVARDAGQRVRRHPRLRAALSARLDPEKATGLALTLALILIFGAGLVLAVLAVIVRSNQDLAGIDSGVAKWGDRHATGPSTEGLRLITELGATRTVLIVGAAIALAEIGRVRSRSIVPFLLAVVVGDKLLTETIKHLVDRVRPDLDPVAATLGPSFPSGHSSTAAAFWAAAALVVGRWCGRRARAVLAGLAVGVAVGVAASRVLLDVHWLTDVIAGLALGWAWFAACAVAFTGRVLRFGAAAQTAAQAVNGTASRGADHSSGRAAAGARSSSQSAPGSRQRPSAS